MFDKENRRHFLKTCGAPTAGTAGWDFTDCRGLRSSGDGCGPGTNTRPMQIGIFTSTFKRPTLAATFDAVVERPDWPACN